MRIVSLMLMLTVAVTPVLAQEPLASIRSLAEKEASALAAQPQANTGRTALFWSGVALGAAGVTTAVLGVTAYRVEDSSTGNAPPGAYQACVAQKIDPVYATNDCDALKGKNRAMLWSGVAIGAVGAALVIGGTHTSADVSMGGVRLLHTVRF